MERLRPHDDFRDHSIPDHHAIDIETDDDLLVRYAHRIPVLAVDGADRLELVITRPDLEDALAR